MAAAVIIVGAQVLNQTGEPIDGDYGITKNTDRYSTPGKRSA
jgi:hypothetical protein